MGDYGHYACVTVTGQQLPLGHTDLKSHISLPTYSLTLHTENGACNQNPNTSVLHQVTI